jgi:amidophosphoribosyltransferase
MSQLGRFIAFEAAVSLLHDRGDTRLLKDIEERCRAQADLPPDMMRNHVAFLYEQFSLDEISAKVAELVRSDKLEWPGEIRVIYQTIEGLHASMPGYTGDWYFTGSYPTPGGYKVLNTAYLNWIDKVDMRAY